MNFIICTSVVLITLFLTCNCIRWYMVPNTQLCLREEIKKNVLVKGMYEVTPVEGQQIDYIITDSKNHILAQKEDISVGKFSFSVEDYDMFEICFYSKVTHLKKTTVKQEIFLDIKTGIEAKNYEEFAKIEKLKPLELDLKRLEDLSRDIAIEFNNMKIKSDIMRNTNESTSQRVFYFSILSMSCILILAIWQVLYLKRYFLSKKLIE